METPPLTDMSFRRSHTFSFKKRIYLRLSLPAGRQEIYHYGNESNPDSVLYLADFSTGIELEF